MLLFCISKGIGLVPTDGIEQIARLRRKGMLRVRFHGVRQLRAAILQGDLISQSLVHVEEEFRAYPELATSRRVGIGIG